MPVDVDVVRSSQARQCRTLLPQAQGREQENNPKSSLLSGRALVPSSEEMGRQRSKNTANQSQPGHSSIYPKRRGLQSRCARTSSVGWRVASRAPLHETRGRVACVRNSLAKRYWYVGIELDGGQSNDDSAAGAGAVGNISTTTLIGPTAACE